MAVQLDKLDRKILQYLTRKARASYREIARALNVSVGTVKNRVERLKKNKVLVGFAPIINHNVLGYNLSAIIALSCDRNQVQEIMKYLESKQCVRSIHFVTGNVDIMIRVRFRNTTELREFLLNDLSIKGIKSSVTYIVLERKTKKGLMSDKAY